MLCNLQTHTNKKAPGASNTEGRTRAEALEFPDPRTLE